MTTFTLPWPPALNNLFATYNGRRIPSRRYKAWLAEAAIAALQQSSFGLCGPFNVTIECSRPDRRKRDLDGLLKAPLDLLVKAALVEDDSMAQQITIRWSDSPPAKPGHVTVTLEAA